MSTHILSCNVPGSQRVIAVYILSPSAFHYMIVFFLHARPL